MIIRDQASPRGRFEPDVRRPLPIPSYMYGAGGIPWAEQKWTIKDAYSRPMRRPLDPVESVCEAGRCGATYLTVQPALSKFCSGACKAWAYKQRRRQMEQRRKRAA